MILKKQTLPLLLGFMITFRAEKQPDGSVLFTHIESFGAWRSFFGDFANWLFFQSIFFRSRQIGN